MGLLGLLRDAAKWIRVYFYEGIFSNKGDVYEYLQNVKYEVFFFFLFVIFFFSEVFLKR